MSLIFTMFGESSLQKITCQLCNWPPVYVGLADVYKKKTKADEREESFKHVQCVSESSTVLQSVIFKGRRKLKNLIYSLIAQDFHCLLIWVRFVTSNARIKKLLKLKHSCRRWICLENIIYQYLLIILKKEGYYILSYSMIESLSKFLYCLKF